MNFKPEKSDFIDKYNSNESQLLWMKTVSDLETPVSAMLKLIDQSDYHILFESVCGGMNKARYSIIALDPDLIWKCENNKSYINRKNIDDNNDYILCDENPFDSLRSILEESKIDIPEELPPMSAGMFGYMNYDMVKLMEDIPDENPDNINTPDGMYFRPKIVIIFDSVKDDAIIVTPIYPDENINAEIAYDNAVDRIQNIIKSFDKPHTPDERFTRDAYAGGSKFQSHITKEEYEDMVVRAKEYIAAGDIFQVVPSRRLSMKFPFSPLALYRSLRHLNPSPYMFYTYMKDFALVGSSPEILVKYDDKVTIRPLAGTRKRGKDADDDKKLADSLLADEKELAEHLMLLDLGRNDVGRVAKPNSVTVTEKMKVEYYSHVMHIVSNVEGELAEGYDCIDALIAGFPAGTVSGAPKIRAMEIIDELEKEKRSFYSGTVGYFSANGQMDTCISLRTSLVKDGMVYAQAGAGVVIDSDPESEFYETENKANAIIVAAEQAKKYL